MSLNADDTIQQKQWAELTPEEKSVIAEIAGDEQEFNLLKQMMKVALEENEQIPPINPALQQTLRKEIKSGKKFYRMAWYAAAAVATGLLLMFFINQNKEKKPPIVKNNPTTPLHNIQTPDSTKAPIPTLQAPPSPVETTMQKQTHLAQIPSDSLPQETGTNKHPTTLYSNVINPTVDADTSLLAFVTEIY